jgi:hypothetical protein
LRSSRDINGNAPSNANEYITVYSKNKLCLNNVYHPKLVIEYKNQSKIKNTGRTNIKGYLLIQVQFKVSGEWVVANDTINETSSRTINREGQFGLDTVFNGIVNTRDLDEYGDGTYRVYAAFRDPDGDVLVCDDESLLEAWYEFEIDTS